MYTYSHSPHQRPAKKTRKPYLLLAAVFALCAFGGWYVLGRKHTNQATGEVMAASTPDTSASTQTNAKSTTDSNAQTPVPNTSSTDSPTRTLNEQSANTGAPYPIIVSPATPVVVDKTTRTVPDAQGVITISCRFEVSFGVSIGGLFARGTDTVRLTVQDLTTLNGTGYVPHDLPMTFTTDTADQTFKTVAAYTLLTNDINYGKAAHLQFVVKRANGEVVKALESDQICK